MHTAKRKSFTVPVFPHIKKFILKKYSEPVKTEEYTSLGKMVSLALRDNRMTAEHNGQQRDRMKDRISIILTKEQAELSPRIGKLIRINHHIDQLFKDHLALWVDALRLDGIAAHSACKLFLKYYDIEESEYSLDAAYKFIQRSEKTKTLKQRNK